MTHLTDDHRRAAVADAITSRRSIRGFLDRPVPLETVRDILSIASRAPSGTNTQPWLVRVLTGTTKTRLCDALVAAHMEGKDATPEYPYYPPRFPSPYIERRRKVGWDLYGLLGIAKGDWEATRLQHAKNFRFFGAPVGMIFTLPRELKTGSFMDVAMFMQNIMVAARGCGLDTCPQAAFAGYYAITRDILGIPEDELVVCGMSLGHADPDEPANALVTERAAVDEFAVFLD